MNAQQWAGWIRAKASDLHDAATCMEEAGKEMQEQHRLARDLAAVLQEALDETGCDGDLCAKSWHEKARKTLARAKELNL